MTRQRTSLGLTVLGFCLAIFAPGCGTSVSEGNLPPEKPASEIPKEQGKIDQEKFMKGMQGMYKGAPK